MLSKNGQSCGTGKQKKHSKKRKDNSNNMENEDASKLKRKWEKRITNKHEKYNK